MEKTKNKVFDVLGVENAKAAAEFKDVKDVKFVIDDDAAVFLGKALVRIVEKVSKSVKDELVALIREELTRIANQPNRLSLDLELGAMTIRLFYDFVREHVRCAIADVLKEYNSKRPTEYHGMVGIAIRYMEEVGCSDIADKIREHERAEGEELLLKSKKDATLLTLMRYHEYEFIEELRRSEVL